MRGTLLILFILHCAIISSHSQEIPPATEQQLESQMDSDQSETEDDSWLPELEQFRKRPIDLNKAGEDELMQLNILTALQIESFISYRSLLGKLISLYELQAVPGWNPFTIRKLLPFISISTTEKPGKRLRDGEHTIIIRMSQVLERSDGFKSSTPGTKYLGSPQRIWLRYQYRYKNLLQFGISADKDAGEQFFKGAQNKGFDFYSFHVFIRKIGIIQSLALGDFTVNMGQGLIQWQSMAFKKSTDVMNTKREAPIIKPYGSAGEFYFFRGCAITVKKKKLEATAFFSFRRLGGNLVNDMITGKKFISSFLTSGYHRTLSETEDRNNLSQLTTGFSIQYNKKKWQMSINGIHYHFSLPVQKKDEPYNLYAINGNNWHNMSTDYSYTYKNLHFFGEAAIDKNFHHAFINGLQVSVDPRVDLSLIQRSIGAAYQSINGNAFTENSYPTNENGIYMGITVRSADTWRIDAYADQYCFPWLKYNTDAPGYGKDFLTGVTYTPNKQVEIYSRFRCESKQGNQSTDQQLSITDKLVFISRKDWRTQINYQLNKIITIRSRVELVWCDNGGLNQQTGFLVFSDIMYKPLLKPVSAALRFQYFETGGYDSRLLTYVNDLLYNFSVPVFSDKGSYWYISLNYNVGKKIGISFHLSEVLYRNKSTVGSGLDEIHDNHKTEVKLQCRYIF